MEPTKKKFVIHKYTVIQFYDEDEDAKYFECIPDLWFMDENRDACYFPPRTGKAYMQRAINCEAPGDNWRIFECTVVSTGYLTYHAGFLVVKEKCSQKYNTSSADEEAQAAKFRREHPGLVGEGIEHIFLKPQSASSAVSSISTGVEKTKPSQPTSSIKKDAIQRSKKLPGALDKTDVEKKTKPSQRKVSKKTNPIQRSTKKPAANVMNKPKQSLHLTPQDNTTVDPCSEVNMTSSKKAKTIEAFIHSHSSSFSQSEENTGSFQVDELVEDQTPRTVRSHHSGSNRSLSSDQNSIRSRSRSIRSQSSHRHSSCYRNQRSSRSSSRNQRSSCSSSRNQRSSHSRTSRQRFSRSSSRNRSSRSSSHNQHSGRSSSRNRSSRSSSRNGRNRRSSHSHQRSSRSRSGYSSRYKKRSTDSRNNHRFDGSEPNRSNANRNTRPNRRRSTSTDSVSSVRSSRHSNDSSRERRHLIQASLMERAENLRFENSSIKVINSRPTNIPISRPSTNSSQYPAVKDLVATVKELTKAVQRNNDQLTQNDRRLHRLEVTINKIFITVGDMNGNYRGNDDELDPEFNFPKIPIETETELYNVHKRLKHKEFRKSWLMQERNFCCPTKTSTDTVTVTKYLKRFISVHVRVQLTLMDNKSGNTLHKRYNQVYKFLIDVIREGYKICGRTITVDEAHTGLRIVWGRSKQLQNEENKRQ